MFTKQIGFEKVSVVFPFSQVLDACEADCFKDRILRWSQASQRTCEATEKTVSLNKKGVKGLTNICCCLSW